MGKKTLCEKEELLVTSNFSFSHNVFHCHISIVRQNVALCGNGLRDTEHVYNMDVSPLKKLQISKSGV